MNMFIREINANKKALLFWSIGMIALVASGMAKYGAYQETGQTMTDLISQFPKSILVIFGISGFDLSSVVGFYGILYIYIALMATVHAVLLGTDIIGKEERDKTSEFLFVKPITRNKVLAAKLLAGLTNILILNFVTLLSSFYFVDYFNKNNFVDNGKIFVLITGLLLLQLLFFFTGAAIATGSKKPKIAPSIAASIMLLTFILSFIININENLNGLKYLTPFKYFDAKILLDTGKLDFLYTSITLILIIVLMLTSFSTYSKRDLNI